jgi:hypothetical protein
MTTPNKDDLIARVESATGRECFGCVYLQSFTPRPDERGRYGFGDTGYGCKERGYEGYVNPTKPICVRGPHLRQQVQS